MKNEAISSPQTTHKTALGNVCSDFPTDGAVLSRKRDCFGAPHVCAPTLRSTMSRYCTISFGFLPAVASRSEASWLRPKRL